MVAILDTVVLSHAILIAADLRTTPGHNYCQENRGNRSPSRHDRHSGSQLLLGGNRSPSMVSLHRKRHGSRPISAGLESQWTYMHYDSYTYTTTKQGVSCIGRKHRPRTGTEV